MTFFCGDILNNVLIHGITFKRERDFNKSFKRDIRNVIVNMIYALFSRSQVIMTALCEEQTEFYYSLKFLRSAPICEQSVLLTPIFLSNLLSE